MEIKTCVNIHNKFEVEIKDIITGEITHAKAENIVLDSMYAVLLSSSDVVVGSYLYFGSGTGTTSPARTTLFSSLGYKATSIVETVYNNPPTPSYTKKKIVILPSENVGATITEVGLATNVGTITTHALLKDSEGAQLSIGPKTDTQEITIYATIYAEITTPVGIIALNSSLGNILLMRLLGTFDANALSSGSRVRLWMSTDKAATNQALNYNAGDWASVGIGFTVVDSVNKKVSTPRIRFGTSEVNGKIWSLSVIYDYSVYRMGMFRALMPCSAFSGYNFLSENIGAGNGATLTFNLPWSDINTTKDYKIYLDGVEQTKDVSYTITNGTSVTSVTFVTAPSNGSIITGDWWVDYIPKDTEHVLDLYFSITYGEG